MVENINIQWEATLAVLRNMAEAIKTEIIKNLAQDGSNASRTLTNSIDYDYGIEDGRYWVYVSMEDYWEYVNDGRKAGKMPPISKIKEWIIIKPVQIRPYTYTPSVRSLAFLFQRSIKEKKGYAPPRSVLEDWIKKKGIQPQPRKVYPSVDSLAFLIARKIGREGTKGTKFLDRAVEAVEKAFNDKIETAIQDDIHYWLEEEMDEFLSTFEP